MSELEAMGDDSLSEVQIVIKDGGKAHVSDSIFSGIVDWSEKGSIIKIGEREGCMVDDMLCLEFEKGKIYLKKISESQTIGEITNTEENSVAK